MRLKLLFKESFHNISQRIDKRVYSWFLLITDSLTCQIETFILMELKDNKDKWIFINYDTSKHF